MPWAGVEAMTLENIERVEWTLQDPTWVPSREYLIKLLAAYKELYADNTRLREYIEVMAAQRKRIKELEGQLAQMHKGMEDLRRHYGPLGFSS
jgi:hypothetical protein